MPTISQLQDVYTNRLENGLANLGYKKLQKKLKRAVINWYRAQYFLADAHRDLRKYFLKNEDICVAVVFIAAAIGYAVSAVAAELIFTFFLTAYTVSEVSGISMLLIALIAGGTLALSVAWVLVFLLNAISIGLLQGANNTKNRSIIKTLRAALKTTGRTSEIWLLLGLRVAAPALALAVAMLSYILIFTNNNTEVIRAIPYGIVALVVSTELVAIRYVLAPIIAANEPRLSSREVFARSSQLVRRRGKLFTLSVHLVIVVALALAFGMSLLLQYLLGISQGLSMSLAIFVALVYSQSVMTALYRKRRLARS